jgi:hypothetical protein
MRGKLMLRNNHSISKLIAGLGIIGLVAGLFPQRLCADIAAGDFSSTVFSGRYACEVIGPNGLSSGVMKVKPNGSGFFSGTGILNVNGDAVGATVGSVCSWTLNALSSYTVIGNGTGFAKLIWDAPSTSSTGCPTGTAGSFTDFVALALRNVTNGNGVVIDAEFSSDNFLNKAAAGRGYCLK